MSTPVRHCVEPVAAPLLCCVCVCVFVCVWMLWSCLSQCCNQVTLLWPASYLNFALTLFNGNGLKEMTKLEMELVPRQVEAGNTADILANCEMGQPKISVILKQCSLSLTLSSLSVFIVIGNVDIVAIDWIRDVHARNKLKSQAKTTPYPFIPLPAFTLMCSSNESGFKNEIAAKMFAHF